MPDSVAEAESDDFAQRSKDFVEWFRNAEGTRLSTKIELADLRHRGAGRGVDYLPAGTLPQLETWLPLIIITVQQMLSNESSMWYPYLQVLPSSLDSLMYWNKAELAELQASPVLKRVGKKKADKVFREEAWPFMQADLEFFEVACDNEDEWEEQAVQLCHQAASLIMAYAFDIDRDEGDRGKEENLFGPDDLQSDDEDNPLKGLVPFADMLNADADRNNARLFQEDDYLIMKAIKPVKAGEECFNDYGPLPRSELLRMYGYITENYKQYDVVDFEHSLLEQIAGAKAQSTSWQKRKEQLDGLGILDDGYSFPRPNPNDKLEDAIPGELHMVLRGLCTDPKDKMQKKGSLTFEEAALLSSATTKKLSEYLTSLEQDKTIDRTSVPNGVSSKRYAMALEVRIGEKEILHNILDLCKHFVETGTNDKKRKHSNGTATPLMRDSKPKKTKT